jgi:hypothetical protein
MSLIVGIYKATNHRRSSAHQFGQLPLGETGFGAKVIELPGELDVSELLLIGGYLLGLLADVAVIRILERVECEVLYRNV